MKTSVNPVNRLAKACADSDKAEDWEEFVRRCAPVVSLVAARVGRLWTGGVTAAVVDDIVQEVFLKLCERQRRILRDFVPQADDSFLGLLRIVSTSVANDHFRRQSSAKRGGRAVTLPLDELLPLAGLVSPQSSEKLHKTMLYSELDERMRVNPNIVTARDRAIFWLYYRQGLTAEEIADLPAVKLSAKGVESVLRRVGRWLSSQLGQDSKGSSAKPISESG